MFDVFFLSYNEPNADANFERLLQFAPHAQRVDGVKGIHFAHLVCASNARTSHFFTVDADNWIVDEFSFDIDFQPEPDAVYVWRCRNAVNGLRYGYGAIKLFPTEHIKNMPVDSVDMTTSVSHKYKIVHTLASETRFNTSEFEAWKSGFREACKLASACIARQKDDETKERLNVWCTVGVAEPFGNWTLDGAREGRAYGEEHAGDPEALRKINDFGWLYHRFLQFKRDYP